MDSKDFGISSFRIGGSCLPERVPEACIQSASIRQLAEDCVVLKSSTCSSIVKLYIINFSMKILLELSHSAVLAHIERLPGRHLPLFRQSSNLAKPCRSVSTNARQKKRRLGRSTELLEAAPEVQELLDNPSSQLPDVYPPGHRAGDAHSMLLLLLILYPEPTSGLTECPAHRVCGNHREAKCRKEHSAEWHPRAEAVHSDSQSTDNAASHHRPAF